jgi:hypothetical protein
MPNTIPITFAHGDGDAHYASTPFLPVFVNNDTLCNYTTAHFSTDLEAPLSCNEFDNEHFESYRPSQAFENATVLECRAVNTSYNDEFEFTSGVQSIRVTTCNSTDSDIVPAGTFCGPSDKQNDCNLFYIYNHSTPTNASFDTPYQSCEFYAQDVRLAAYQGVLWAFNTFVLGYVGNNHVSDPNGIEQLPQGYNPVAFLDIETPCSLPCLRIWKTWLR